MLTMKELKGTALKKALNAKSVSMRWHNKNKSGGNFGFNIRGVPNTAHDFELTGNYNEHGEVFGLIFGRIYWGATPIRANSYDMLIQILKGYLDNLTNVA